MTVSVTDSSNNPWQEDQEPWYRQFWPWFLIALPGSVVIAALSTVYIANRHADDLVVDDYYKDGLAINVQIERQRKAAELGIQASITILDQRIQVRLDEENYADDIELRLSHPLEADRDFRMMLSAVAPGLYVGEAPRNPAPNWHWIIDSPSGEWRLDGSLTAANFIGGSLDSEAAEGSLPAEGFLGAEGSLPAEGSP